MRTSAVMLLTLAALLPACASKEADEKAVLQDVANKVNPTLTKLQPFHARILELPEKSDSTTVAKMAMACTEAKSTVRDLTMLSPGPEGREKSLFLIDLAAEAFVREVDTNCKSLTVGTSMSCWKSCSTAWSHLETTVETVLLKASPLGITITSLDPKPPK